MDSEVNVLMGATDEELWERAGLFNLVDAMCRNKGSRCHIDDLVNNSWSILEELAITPTTNTKPHYQTVRVSETQNTQGSAGMPGEVFVGTSSASKEQGIGGLERQYKAEVPLNTHAA